MYFSGVNGHLYRHGSVFVHIARCHGNHARQPHGCYMTRHLTTPSTQPDMSLSILTKVARHAMFDPDCYQKTSSSIIKQQHNSCDEKKLVISLTEDKITYRNKSESLYHSKETVDAFATDVENVNRVNKRTMCDFYEFKCPTYYESAFKTLYQFYENGQLCDVKIKVGGKQLLSHKLVLSCMSRYFRDILLSRDNSVGKSGNISRDESLLDTIEIPDTKITFDTMNDIVKFCYLANITITTENVQSVLHAATFLKIDRLSTACCEFMKHRLHSTNCLAIYIYSQQHLHQELVQITQDYITENFVEFLDQVEEFPQDLLEALVKSPRLNVEDEAQVYEAVIRWILYDEPIRKPSLTSLISHIKLPLLSPNYLMNNVETEPLMNQSLECRDLLDEAKRYQMSLGSLLSGVKVTERVMARYSYAGVLLCVGGRGSSGDPFHTTECYDVRYDTWFPVASMCHRRRHVGVCSASGVVYAVGGHNGLDHLSTCEMYHPSTNKWTSFASMKTKRRGLAVACLGGPIYAVGGLDNDTTYSTTERYEPSTDTWSTMADLTVPRGGLCLVALKGQLYAVGGSNGVTCATCEVYSPFVDKWTVVTDMTSPRAGAGAAVLNGYLYVAGGFNDTTPLSTMEVYNSHTDTWTSVCDMQHRRGGVGLAALGGRLYAVGGHDGERYLKSVEVYDPIYDSWSAAGSIADCRAGAGLVFCDCPVAQLADEGLGFYEDIKDTSL